MQHNKGVAILLVALLLVAGSGTVFASESLTRGAASLVLPGWGQYLNGELDTKNGKIKTGAMIIIEVAAIVTTAVVGGVSGSPAVWVGLGLLIANHVWSATDAYVNASAGVEVSMQEYTSER